MIGSLITKARQWLRTELASAVLTIMVSVLSFILAVCATSGLVDLIFGRDVGDSIEYKPAPLSSPVTYVVISSFAINVFIIHAGLFVLILVPVYSKQGEHISTRDFLGRRLGGFYETAFRNVFKGDGNDEAGESEGNN